MSRKKIINIGPNPGLFKCLDHNQYFIVNTQDWKQFTIKFIKNTFPFSTLNFNNSIIILHNEQIRINHLIYNILDHLNHVIIPNEFLKFDIKVRTYYNILYNHLYDACIYKIQYINNLVQ